ncbi:MAG: hypothetical protein AB8G96_01285 [Phycisphaerales bacterium]
MPHSGHHSDPNARTPDDRAPAPAPASGAGAAPGAAALALPFADDLREAVQALRAALLGLLADVGGDPSRPQDIARRFGLNKNLTWKISRLVGDGDPLGAVPHVPGRSGVEIFLRAMERAGASTVHVGAVQAAADALDAAARRHTDDRPTLEMMIDAALPMPQQTEQFRRLAFQGNSGTWGVRAKTQVAMHVLMPSDDAPGMVDLVQIGGLLGFKRLRAGTRWLLFRRERWSDDGSSVGADDVRPLDPASGGAVPLLPKFCSRPLPTIDVTQTPGEEQYELPPGPVGKTAALDCVYGQVARKVGPDHAEKPGEHTEIGCSVITPCEHLVLDLLVHRSCAWAMRPELMVVGRLDGSGLHDDGQRRRNLIAVPETVRDLGFGLDGLATPAAPGQRELAAWTLDQVDRDPREFRALRVVMSHPPIPIAILLRSALPVRGDEGRA